MPWHLLLFCIVPCICNAWSETHRVDPTQLPLSAPSYAGHINIDSANGASIFYWLFWPQNGKPPQSAPVVFWMNGGPGLSSMFGLLSEIGPLQVTKNATLVRRMLHWNEEYTLVFVDQPIGVGFSRKGSHPYVRSTSVTSAHMLSFMQGLLRLHTELQLADLYLSGESFCGHYFPPMAKAILDYNDRGGSPRIRLKGMSIGGMQADIRLRVKNWPEQLATLLSYDAALRAQAYAFGLLTEAQHARGKALAQEFLTKIDEPGHFLEAMKPKHDLEEMIAVAGVNKLNLERQQGDYCLFQFTSFMNKSSTAQLLNVGGGKFVTRSPDAQSALIADMRNSYMAEFAFLLSRIRVLLYEGTWDWEDGVGPLQEWLAALPVNLSLPRRRHWLSDGVLLGWTSEQDNLTHAVVRSAGHLTPIDQPYAALDLMQRWLSRSSLTEDKPGYKAARALQASIAGHSCGERFSLPPPPSASPATEGPLDHAFPLIAAVLVGMCLGAGVTYAAWGLFRRGQLSYLTELQEQLVQQKGSQV